MNNDLIVEYVNRFKTIDFPFPYQDISPKKEYNKLFKTEKKLSNVGISLVYYYHPSLFLANKLNKLSPYEA